MKTLFTFSIIIAFLISGYAKNSNSLNQENGIQANSLQIDSPTITIAKLYPNPVKDFTTIELQSKVSGNLTISLFNILGTEVKKWDAIFINQGTQNFKIDLSSFKTGIYILNISISGQVRTQILKKI